MLIARKILSGRKRIIRASKTDAPKITQKNPVISFRAGPFSHPAGYTGAFVIMKFLL